MNSSPSNVFEAIGQCETFLEFQERLSHVAPVERPVLLIGERGTGKELAATRIHCLSPRWKERFVTLNCAALSPGLIESELFGHEAGAFTGAVSRRTGRFEAANGGTLFLDEIGAIPIEVQEKILRVVEYGVFERVGGSESIHVDVRLIGATNADLIAMTQTGQFKSDLLDRLSFDVLFLPPLRCRHDDIMLLACHFAARMARELGRREVPEFSDEAVAALESYPWPGNIRELKNVVERAVYRANGTKIRGIIFNPFDSPFASLDKGAPRREGMQPLVSRAEILETEPTEAPASNSIESAVRDVELRLIRKALLEANWNQRKAAENLGLTYHQFRGYYRKYKTELTGE